MSGVWKAAPSTEPRSRTLYAAGCLAQALLLPLASYALWWWFDAPGAIVGLLSPLVIPFVFERWVMRRSGRESMRALAIWVAITLVSLFGAYRCSQVVGGL
jgi:hypothetical protein